MTERSGTSIAFPSGYRRSFAEEETSFEHLRLFSTAAQWRSTMAPTMFLKAGSYPMLWAFIDTPSHDNRSLNAQTHIARCRQMPPSDLPPRTQYIGAR